MYCVNGGPGTASGKLDLEFDGELDDKLEQLEEKAPYSYMQDPKKRGKWGMIWTVVEDQGHEGNQQIGKAAGANA